ncbi:MAG: lipase family alpha/beta hydrolase, partial [Anaerolineales bacterium]
MPAKTLTTARWLAAVALLVLSAAPPQPAVMATTTTRAPIVFIPGVMGSRLFNTVDEQEREVWVNLPGALFTSFPELGLAADGISPAQDDPAYSTIHAKPGTAGLVTRVLVADFYETLINHFTQTHGYVESADFWVYTYDWRKDLRTSADDLDVLIQNILAQTGASQVSIVAHSLGGLLARQYLFDPARAARVGQAVILGTPFFGTPQAFSALLDGDCLLGVSPICIPGRQTIKELVRNYPAFYQIMPSEAYFAAKGGGFYGVGRGMDVTGPCPDCLSYSQTYTTSLGSSLNLTLSGQAWQFHAALDALANWNGVPVTVIAGQGKNTLAGIRQRERFWWEVWRSTIIREPQYSIAGDGTVTLLSANMSSSYDNPQVRVFNADHVALVKRPEVLAYMDSALG